LKQRLNEKRKIRLLQVREQERGLAREMCSRVQARKENEQQAQEAQMRAHLAKSSLKELEDLEYLYRNRMREFGKGHRDARDTAQVMTCMISGRMIPQCK